MTNSDTPAISVLMCCYNSSEWLQEAIDSVLTQTYPDFELVLVNDGSTDDTAEILENNQRQDARVVLFHKDHSGLTASLNEGLSKAKGRWVARLDSDDLCAPERLDRQLSFAVGNDVVLVGSGFHEIAEDGDKIKTHYYPHQHHRLIRHLERSRGFFPHSSAMFDRRVALDAGGYNPRFLMSQDRDLWARLAEAGRIACLEEPLVRVRKHATSVSNAESGHSQFIYGTLASACFLLREAGAPDPSSSPDDPMWTEFLAWASRHPETMKGQARFRAWNEARAVYFGRRNRLSGLLAFVASLMRKGASLQLIKDKVLGSSLPGRLAKDWQKRSCAAS